MKSTFYISILVVIGIISMGCIGDKEPSGSIDNNAELPLTLQSTPVSLNEGASGSIEIPLIGANFVDTDVKHHWDMSNNVTKVMVNVTLSGPSRTIELSTGTGDCPHSGEMLASTTGSEDMLSVTFEAEANSTLQETMWFCHLALSNQGSHRGDTINYVFTVTLFSYGELECEDEVCPT